MSPVRQKTYIHVNEILIRESTTLVRTSN